MRGLAAVGLPLAVILAGSFPLRDVAGQNLVTNPGFEAGVDPFGPPPGYTVTGNGGGGNVFVSSLFPHTGDYSFGFADAAPASGTLAQTLPTTAGATYLISFFASNLGASGLSDVLTVTFGDVPVFSAPIFHLGYQQFTATGVAAGPSTVLAFTGTNGATVTVIDDLSVTAVPNVAPEPGTWALLVPGLLAVGAVARRRGASATRGHPVRVAPERLEQAAPAGPTLVTLAHDLGFASHAPLVRAMRRHAGATPSGVRALVREGIG